MAAMATAGCMPSNCNSNRPQSNSWIERGMASRRRISSAGRAVPAMVRQTVRELITPRARPSTRLLAQPHRAMPRVIARPVDTDSSSGRSKLGRRAAVANWPSNSQPPPWPRPGSSSSTGSSTRAGASNQRGAAGRGSRRQVWGRIMIRAWPMVARPPQCRPPQCRQPQCRPHWRRRRGHPAG